MKSKPTAVTALSVAWPDPHSACVVLRQRLLMLNIAKKADETVNIFCDFISPLRNEHLLIPLFIIKIK